MYRDEQHSLLTKNIKYYINRTLKYLNLFSKWVISATLIGILCGLVGTAFHKCVELATVSERRGFYISCRLPVY